MRLPDIQIRGGTLIDGTGAAPFSGCVDITDGKISAVGGPELPAREIIDASGLTVTPGFIDAHTHADLAALRPEETDCFLYQGVTSCVCGNCGFSAFPLRGEGREAHLRYAQGVMGPYRAEDGWDSFAGYQTAAAGILPLNVAFLVGHGALRASVMGAGDRRPDPAETAAECTLLDQQLAEGVLGLSLGLIYSPGSTAAREEFLALAETVRRHDAILAVHLRDEGAALPDSMEEIFSIARQTGVRVELSHHKVMGLRNWGLSRTSLALAEQARREGLRVGLDAYPYDAACSTGLVLLPPWALSGGVERTMELLADKAALACMERDQMCIRDSVKTVELTAREANCSGPVVLEAKDVCLGNRLDHVSIQLHEGEVLGLAGLVGAGRTELLKTIFGAYHPDSGMIAIHGKVCREMTPKKAVSMGIAYMSEDRKNEGLLLQMSVEDNMIYSCMPSFSRFGLLRVSERAKTVDTMTRRLRLKTSGSKSLVGALSGGNQQKVVIAKWLAANSSIILMDEPTRGIDVGAKSEIYALVRQLADEGKSIIFVSSELEEVQLVSDRILVMGQGKVTAELPMNATVEEMMRYAV